MATNDQVRMPRLEGKGTEAAAPKSGHVTSSTIHIRFPEHALQLPQVVIVDLILHHLGARLIA